MPWSVPLMLVFAVAVGGGCTRVQAHQRGTLARVDMELGTFAPLAAGEDHARGYREGSSGGSKGKAGGCGCN